jgi:excisionase family DNA binding protein
LAPLSSPEVDTRTAASLLGLTTSRVRQLLRSGEFAGRKVGNVWLVSATSVAGYLDVRSEA